MQRACKTCHYISEEPLCPRTTCGCDEEQLKAPQCPETNEPHAKCNEPTSKSWSGFLSVMDSENSELAHAMKISNPGNYALKVR